MKGKSVALLVLALGCGLVASLGIMQMLSNRGGAPAPTDTAPVVVASVDILVGGRLGQDNTKLELWPKDKVPPEAVLRQEDLTGRRARQKIFAGEPIISPKLLAHGEVSTDSLIPKGLRVVPIQVGLEAIHSGLVLPGSRCDVQVFIRANPSLGISETVCKTVLQDIRVFAVNDVTSTESADPRTPDTKSIPTGKTVSLLVTPAQAQIVTLASELGQILLIMRSGEDCEQPKTLVMTAHELLGAAGGGDRAKENPAEANEKRFKEWAESIRKSLQEEARADSAHTRAGDQPQRFTMRLRMGPEVSDVLLVNDSTVQSLPGDEGAWTATGMGPSSRGKAEMETHGPKPVDGGPAVLPGPSAQPKAENNSPLPPVRLGYTPPVGS